MPATRTWATLSIVCWLASSSCRSLSGTDETDANGDATSEERDSRVHGSLSSRFRGRTGGGDHDQDLYSVLALDVGGGRNASWSGSLLLEAAADIDGRADSTSAFQSVGDASDGSVRTRVYEAWVENHDVDALSRLRLGRQMDYETPVIVTYDGLAIVTREAGPTRAQFGLYGGVPVHFDASTHPGESVVGAHSALHPWDGARARLDWMHVEDHAYFGRASDDLAALDLRQDLGERVQVDGHASSLDGSARDVRLDGTYADSDGELVVRASAYRLLATQNELAQEFDPFTRILLEQFPYTQMEFTASKSVGTHARVEAGFDTRHVDDDADEGPFNRDFERWYATGILDDAFATGFSVSLTGDAWNSSRDQSSSLDVDVSHAVGSTGRLSLGSAYALYEYDLFNLEERDHVRTYYMGLRFRRKSGLSWDVRYEHEDSFHDYDTLRLGVTWRF